MKRIFVLVVAVLCSRLCPAVAEDLESPVKPSAFIDTYYAYDFNYDERKRPYVTQPYYNDEPSVNLAFMDATLSTEGWRGRAALQDGTSVDINYAAEPHEGWRYVQEAYVGSKLADGLWLDAGIFFSHIGMESWISRDNPTYTRSLVAEYSPYYQTGVKISYEASDAWSFQLLGLRGWQNISDDRDPALGTQIQWKLSPKVSFLHNTFIGYESGRRIFNDLILKWSPTESLSFAAQFDVGLQRQASDDDTARWSGWAVIGQYRFTPKIAVAARVERFLDSEGVVLASASDNRFGAYGFSLNFDYEILSRLLLRTEWRRMQDTKQVFPNDNEGFDKSDTIVVTSLCYTLK